MTRCRKLLIPAFVTLFFILFSQTIIYAATIDYTYDALNRLIKVEYKDPPNLVIEYTYDAAGNRLTKSVNTPTVTFTITATAQSYGTINPSGAVLVQQGANQAFSITANAGYAIDDVKVDNASVGAVASYTFSNVQANHTIHATFRTASLAITAVADPHGQISPSGTVGVTYGSNRNFVITPDQYWHVSDVLVDGVSVGAVLSYNFVNITASRTIQARFAWDDTDNDGLPDWWEMLHFGNLSQTATGDFDGDGLTNLQEYQMGTDPKVITPHCNGDFNKDMRVDLTDLYVFVAEFGRSDCIGNCQADFNQDGNVDGADLAAFVASYGRTDCPIFDPPQY
jgi:YD repeat-containing protein